MFVESSSACLVFLSTRAVNGTNQKKIVCLARNNKNSKISQFYIFCLLRKGGLREVTFISVNLFGKL